MRPAPKLAAWTAGEALDNIAQATIASVLEFVHGERLTRRA